MYVISVYHQIDVYNRIDYILICIKAWICMFDAWKKSQNNIIPNGSNEIHGDESHGPRSVTKNTLSKSKVLAKWNNISPT